jgi:hypothetical protein
MGARPKIAYVVRDYGICSPVHRGLEHQFIDRIAELRTPQEIQIDRLCRAGKCRKESFDILGAHACVRHAIAVGSAGRIRNRTARIRVAETAKQGPGWPQPRAV